MESTNNLPTQENNPSTQPDLFPSPALPQAPEALPPKKNRKMLLLIPVIVILLIGIVMAAVVLTRRPTKQPQNLAVGTLSPAESKAVVQKYLDALKDGKHDEAFRFTNFPGVDEQTFMNTTAPTIMKVYDVPKCEMKDDSSQKPNAALVYCPYSHGGAALTEYQLTVKDSQPHIVKVVTIRQDKAK